MTRRGTGVHEKLHSLFTGRRLFVRCGGSGRQRPPQAEIVHHDVGAQSPAGRRGITACGRLQQTSVSGRPFFALATFVFMFVDPTIDVTRSYGNELVLSHDKDTITVAVSDNCIFEEKFTNAGRVQQVRRWNFNKAFFNEARDKDEGIFIPGEDGVVHVAHYCDLGNGKCFDRPIEERDGAFVGMPVTDERQIKALQYFINNFCPGTKRKSAF